MNENNRITKMGRIMIFLVTRLMLGLMIGLVVLLVIYMKGFAFAFVCAMVVGVGGLVLTELYRGSEIQISRLTLVISFVCLLLLIF